MTNKIQKLNASIKSSPSSEIEMFSINNIPPNDTLDAFKVICDKIDEIIDFLNNKNEETK
jgi:hypothetical protein